LDASIGCKDCELRMRFFRGISVSESDADQVIADITDNGLKSAGSMWRMSHERPIDPGALFQKDDLSTDDTRPEEHVVPAICGCGDMDGALYYATRHNYSDQKNAPILIELEADLEKVAIDGRDFLYTVFQMGSPERSGQVLEQCFGPKILTYATKAWASDNHGYRIALCDLAIHDPQVISSHHANDLVIAGRCNTLFRSAFTVSLPILPSKIIQVRLVSSSVPLPRANFTMSDIR
jgi:hypothetical protein